MKKLPYEQVAIEINKLYDFSMTDSKLIDDRLMLIEAMIEASGWTIDDYNQAMFSFDEGS